MTVGLVMIVKNEAEILPRFAASVARQIDYWTVVDTGSEDNTRDVVKEVFRPVPGKLVEHTFDGYGPSRTFALMEAEAHTDWMLVLDADDIFHGTLKDVVIGDEIDCVECEMRQGDLRFWLPKLLRSNRGWESRGRSHEYYTSPIAHPPVRTDAFWVEHLGDGSGRVDKFQRDIALLTQDWEEDHNNERAAFYLARSYDDVGDLGQAVSWYRTRVGMNGWIEETFYAYYRLGACLLALGAKEEGCGNLWHAWGLKTERAEPLVALAEHYRTIELWETAWLTMELAYAHCKAQPQDMYMATTPYESPQGLFVDMSATAWRCAYEQSISAWYTGNKERGRYLTQWLLSSSQIPEPFLSSVKSNMGFYE